MQLEVCLNHQTEASAYFSAKLKATCLCLLRSLRCLLGLLGRASGRRSQPLRFQAQLAGLAIDAAKFSERLRMDAVKIITISRLMFLAIAAC